MNSQIDTSVAISSEGNNNEEQKPSALKHRVVFVSHGAPSLIIEPEKPTNNFLQQLGKDIGKPSAIIVVSGHWERSVVEVNTTPNPDVIYDFGGFPDRMYSLKYPAPGSPELAQQILAALKEKGIACAANSKHGLDHGAWCPLKMMYPDADIPVVQVSLVRTAEPSLHLQIGEALTSILRSNENILLLASGGVTHNLGEIWSAMSRGENAPRATWAVGFAKWVEESLTGKDETDRQAAIGAWDRHPYAKKAHPTADHFLPLVVAAGVKGTGRAIKLHDAFFYDLSLEAYAFPFIE